MLDVQYVRDKLGRISQKTEIISGVTATFDYLYDLVGRLREVKKDGTTIATYTYDSNGNRLTFSDGTVSPAVTVTGIYDAQDRLTNYGDLEFTYTPNGEQVTKNNPVLGQAVNYSYDGLGNLIGATLPNGTLIEYVLDAQNRRLGKKVNGSLVQGFLYQDQLNPIAELDSLGNVSSRFVYGTKTNVPDYLVKGGVTYRIISDNLGSPRLVIDSSTGAIIQRIDYDEFGGILLDTNLGFQPFGFAGGIYDQDTGLTHFGAREYDAQTGRWTSKDPTKFSGQDSNLYTYAINDPINYLDPFGEFFTPDTIVDIGLIVYDLYRLISDIINCGTGGLGTNLAALGADIIGAITPGGTGFGPAVRIANAADNAADAVRVNKAKASANQLAEEGKVIAGKGSNDVFRDAQKAADKYGGNPNDWVKKTSTDHTAPDGTQFQTHWVENLNTGQRVEHKTKILKSPTR